MIVGNLGHTERYECLHPSLKKLFDFVNSANFDALPLGRVDVDGDNLYVMNLDINGVSSQGQPLEAHRDYMDVHILLDGEEQIGWKDIEDVRSFTQPYNPAADCALSADPPAFYANLRPGQFALMWPDDAHAPGVGKGRIRKLVGKLKL